MKKIFKKIFSLFFEFERRRAERVPCKTRAHFCMIGRESEDRGNATITDMTREGFCCDDMHFFRNDPNFQFKIGQSLEIYFTLPLANGTKTNFEVVGKIRSIMVKDRFGHSKRFGIKIYNIKKGSKKLFLECVDYIASLAQNGTPYTAF